MIHHIRAKKLAKKCRRKKEGHQVKDEPGKTDNHKVN